MRIVIDLQGAQCASRFRGIGRYSLGISKSIVRNRGSHEILIALSGLFPDSIEPLRAEFGQWLKPEEICVWHGPGPVGHIYPEYEWIRRSAELIRESFLAALCPDVVIVTSVFEGTMDNAVTSIARLKGGPPTAVILYDLIPLMWPDLFLQIPEIKAWYEGKLEHLKQADLLLGISEYSRREAVAALHFEMSRTATIGAAVDDRFRPLSMLPDQVRRLWARFGIRRPYIQCTGNLDPNKNIESVIRAFAMMPPQVRQEYQLLIVNQRDATENDRFTKIAQGAGLKPDELVLTGFVTDDELVGLYNQCSLLVLPSLHEGFGLPALEAMSCGAPAIGSAAAAVPEVIGWSEALFDPLEIEAIAEKMVCALTDVAYRNRLLANAQTQAGKFSWDRCGIEAISAIEGLFTPSTGTSPVHLHSGRSSGRHGLLDHIAAMQCTVHPQPSELRAVAASIALNEAGPIAGRLLVDVSEFRLYERNTGIQRVVRNILTEMLHSPGLDRAVVPIYLDDIGNWRYAFDVSERLTGEVARPESGRLIDIFPRDSFIGLDLSPFMIPANAAGLQVMRNFGIAIHFVVYDTIPLLHPEWVTSITAAAFREWIGIVSNIADSLICISAAVAEEVRAWLQTHPPTRHRPLKIEHFHLGSDIMNSLATVGLPENAQQVLSRLQVAPSFLMVGTLEPRKGHAQVLGAMEQLWRSGVDANLVIVGKEGWLVDEPTKLLSRHPENGRRLFWLEAISDEFLLKVYESSTALIAASHAEGFGLPLIEAAQQKLPIIARDIPVFREVAGEHAYYFDSKEPSVLADALSAWLHAYQQGDAPRSDSMPHLTWKQSTQQLLQAILGD